MCVQACTATRRQLEQFNFFCQYYSIPYHHFGTHHRFGITFITNHHGAWIQTLAGEQNGVVQDSVQWSEGDSWPVGERADSAGTIGEVESVRDKVDKGDQNEDRVRPIKVL